MVAIFHNIRSIHNTGSMFRTADAAGIEKLYLCGITPSPLDRFGKKRRDFTKTSLGAEDSILWEKIADTEKLIVALKHAGYKIISLEQHPRSVPYWRKDASGKNMALIVGNEVEGIPDSILDLSDCIIEIPMHGKKESLNVSVSFGIAAYELNKKSAK